MLSPHTHTVGENTHPTNDHRHPPPQYTPTPIPPSHPCPACAQSQSTNKQSPPQQHTLPHILYIFTFFIFFLPQPTASRVATPWGLHQHQHPDGQSLAKATGLSVVCARCTDLWQLTPAQPQPQLLVHQTTAAHTKVQVEKPLQTKLASAMPPWVSRQKSWPIDPLQYMPGLSVHNQVCGKGIWNEPREWDSYLKIAGPFTQRHPNSLSYSTQMHAGAHSV